MNLAEQLKQELTERAKNSESCKKYLLDYVLNCFRDGENPVEIKISNFVYKPTNEKWLNAVGYDKNRDYSINFKYEDGRHYARVNSSGSKWIDITDHEMAQMYACDGKDVSDKTLFLESEGFHVRKTWVYGKGDLLEIFY